MFIERYFLEINYFDHFYFIRVYLNLFHAALLASGTHPIHYVVYSSRKITKSDLGAGNIYDLEYITFKILKPMFRNSRYTLMPRLNGFCYNYSIICS